MPDDTGEPVVTTVCFLPLHTGCGCIGHPAFPAPSIFQGERFLHNSGASRRGARTRVGPRGHRIVSSCARCNHLIWRTFRHSFHIAGNKFNSVEIVCRSRDHHVEQHQQGSEMARMRAIEAAVRILEKEGVVCAFGVPGAAINPLYSALRMRGSINHILARHVEAASHMAEGYNRAHASNIGVCIGTSGPAGTDMITGLYSAIADSIPILCITGQAPRARLYKEDFQAVDIEAIAKPVTKWATTVREPALVPRVFSQAFHIMRSGRPGPVLIDLPLDVQLAEIEFDDETYEPLPVYRPAATRKQIEKALDMLNAAERPLIVAGGGVINADASDLLPSVG